MIQSNWRLFIDENVRECLSSRCLIAPVGVTGIFGELSGYLRRLDCRGPDFGLYKVRPPLVRGTAAGILAQILRAGVSFSVTPFGAQVLGNHSGCPSRGPVFLLLGSGDCQDGGEEVMSFFAKPACLGVCLLWRAQKRSRFPHTHTPSPSEPEPLRAPARRSRGVSRT